MARRKTASEIITHPIAHLDFITNHFRSNEFMITPVGTDCYSSFLAKSIENYFPSVFGFRNINPEFTSNYLDNTNETSYLTLLNALDITCNSIGLIKNFKQFGETNIHCLENPFGLFLLNHDGGFDTPRPYTNEILQHDVLDRLAHLDMTTYAFLFGFNTCKRKIIVFSGTHEKKTRLIESMRKNMNKFSSKSYQLLFLNLMPILEGTDGPQVTCDGTQINVQLFKGHSNYGNVAANWSKIKDELIKNTRHLIQSNSLPIIH